MNSMATIEHSEKNNRVAHKHDASLMRRALKLAAEGCGQVSPSPLVGCVIASPDGEIFGEGVYLYEHVHHAERLALDRAGERARGATAYVTLEPHAHHGRTPPCTDALIQAGIARVVAPIEDPNPLVAGRGFQALRAAGIDVSVGLMKREAACQNETYIHAMRHARPFVHLKLATSLDGRINFNRQTTPDNVRWITNTKSRIRVHEMRREYDAILVGAGTIKADDPLLTDRSHKPRRRPLVRIVMDGKLNISLNSRVVRTADAENPVLIFSDYARADLDRVREFERRGVEVELLQNGTRDLVEILARLYRRSLQSLFLEGGSQIAGSFVDAGLIDKVSFFVAPLIIGGSHATSAINGIGLHAFRLRDVERHAHGDDTEITGYPEAK